MTCGRPCPEHGAWNRKFCVVTDGQMLLLDKEEVKKHLAKLSHMDAQRGLYHRQTSLQLGLENL